MILDWIVQNIIALLAVVISAIAAYFTYKQGDKSNKLKERLVKLEERRDAEKRKQQQKADIVAKIDFNNNGGYQIPGRIRISNQGMADAKNISIRIDGHPPSEINYLYTGDHKDELPILPSGDFYEYPFGMDKQDEAPIEVLVTYDDPLDSRKRYKQDLRH